jgi:Tol biopolymer transport system component
MMVVDDKEGEGSQNLSRPVFSPDSQRLAYWRTRGGRTVMVVDGKEGPEFEKLGDPAFSPDSRRVAYAVKKPKGKWTMIVDGQEGTELEEATFPVFSPDSKRLAYAARQGGWRIVIDGKEGPVFRSVTRPAFSSDSRRIAYLGLPGKLEKAIKVQVVRNLAGLSALTNVWVPMVDDQPGEPNLIIAGPAFSADGKRVAYATGDHVQSTLFIDGQKVQEFSVKRKSRMLLVRNLTFSPDGKRVACELAEGGHVYINGIVQTGNESGQAQRRVVLDGQEGKELDVFGLVNLRFSPDSRHLAYEAQGPLKSWIVIDGREGKPYQQVLWGSLFFTSNDSVTYVAVEGKKLYRVTQSINSSKDSQQNHP